MLIKMVTRASGPEFSAAPGDTVEVTAAIGRPLVEGGYAQDVTKKTSEEPSIEPDTDQRTGGKARNARRSKKPAVD